MRGNGATGTEKAGRPDEDWAAEVPTDTGRLTLFGVVAGVLLLGSFSIWASVVPIASAAVASGVLTATGHNHLVQHPTGGVVDDILVAEGETVARGEPLVRLDQTAATASRDRILREMTHLFARTDRLRAMRGGLQELKFSLVTLGFLGQDEALGILDMERAEFAAGLAQYQNERSVLNAQMAGYVHQQRASTHRRTASKSRHALVLEDVERLRSLHERGVVGSSELSRVLQQEAELDGAFREADAQRAAIGRSIAETRERIAGLETRRLQEAAQEISKAQARIDDLRKQLEEAEDVLSRTVLRAPANGTVVRLHVNARGSVVMPGRAVVELLPTENELVVEARVSPTDVARLRSGQEARLRFPTIDTASIEELQATLNYVSVDRLEDPSTGSPFYVSRLRISEDVPPELAERLMAGMPVEVFFTTGSRTFFAYVLRPLTDSLSRAFRES